MKTVNLGPHSMYPASPTQRFVDSEGNDITGNVTAYNSDVFERALIRHRFVVIDITDIMEAVRAAFGESMPDDEHEEQFGASYVSGNTTKH